MAVWTVGASGAQDRSMVELTLRGQRVEGLPLAFSTQQVLLLGRDGRLWDFDPHDARDYRPTTRDFRSLPVSELRAMLLRELGAGYEVTSTHHYMVAHPQGQRDQWAQRFEDLYRSLVHYFTVRGFRLSEPEFPLLGVVCRNRQEFQTYAAREGLGEARGVLGFYALASNRILLYDVGAGKSNPGDWRQNASVVIHEATHQTAFNTGIHNRFSPPPVWVTEGLATMFEAPGVYDSLNHMRPADRINYSRLTQFRKQVLPRHRPETIADLLASDQAFKSDPAFAYAEAWALTYYLVEVLPRKYADYLARTARRPAFSLYPATQRTADFTAVFGSDYRLLEAHFLRFIKEQPSAP
jgi:hypothetical protein